MLLNTRYSLQGETTCANFPQVRHLWGFFVCLHCIKFRKVSDDLLSLWILIEWKQKVVIRAFFHRNVFYPNKLNIFVL